MLEAAYAGCAPLVPDRLAYPELYPAEMRYGTHEELVSRLRSLIAERPAPGTARAIAEPYTFAELVPRYAELFERGGEGVGEVIGMGPLKVSTLRRFGGHRRSFRTEWRRERERGEVIPIKQTGGVGVDPIPLMYRH